MIFYIMHMLIQGFPILSWQLQIKRRVQAGIKGAKVEATKAKEDEVIHGL